MGDSFSGFFESEAFDLLPPMTFNQGPVENMEAQLPSVSETVSSTRSTMTALPRKIYFRLAPSSHVGRRGVKLYRTGKDKFMGRAGAHGEDICLHLLNPNSPAGEWRWELDYENSHVLKQTFRWNGTDDLEGQEVPVTSGKTTVDLMVFPK